MADPALEAVVSWNDTHDEGWVPDELVNLARAALEKSAANESPRSIEHVGPGQEPAEGGDG